MGEFKEINNPYPKDKSELENEEYQSGLTMENYEWLDETERENKAKELLNDLMTKLQENIDKLFEQGASPKDIRELLNDVRGDNSYLNSIRLYLGPSMISRRLSNEALTGKYTEGSFKNIGEVIKDKILNSEFSSGDIIKGVSEMDAALDSSFERLAEEIKLRQTKKKRRSEEESMIDKLRKFLK